LEQRINENWPDSILEQQQQSQKSGVILSAATEFTKQPIK